MQRNKSSISLIVVLVFAFSLFAYPFAVSASSYSFKFTTGKATFTDTFGKTYALPHSSFVKSNVYFVPLRAVVEEAGGVVTYIPQTKAVKLACGKNKGYLLIGKKYATVNGTVFTLSLPSLLIKNRTMVDVRFIAKLLNGTVKIDGSKCTLSFYRIFEGIDVLKHKVALYSKPKRIVSLAPNLTEILFAVGAGNRVVGVSSYSDYPKEALSKPKVGGFFSPSIERIFALNPDLILVARGTPLSIINKFTSLRMNVFTSDPHTISDIYTLIITVGKLTGNVEQSLHVVRGMKAMENKIVKMVKGIPQSKRKKVYVEIWNNPKMSVGKGTFIDSLIKEAGGINIAENAKGDWPIMSDETIIKENPDVIILLYKGNIQSVKNRPGWENISAVKNGEIYVENPDIFERPGPRIVQGLAELYRLLYGKNGG
jgi:iron complex transport system substrate-binding protein